jgi:hypothetical protein
MQLLGSSIAGAYTRNTLPFDMCAAITWHDTALQRQVSAAAVYMGGNKVIASTAHPSSLMDTQDSFANPPTRERMPSLQTQSASSLDSKGSSPSESSRRLRTSNTITCAHPSRRRTARNMPQASLMLSATDTMLQRRTGTCNYCWRPCALTADGCLVSVLGVRWLRCVGARTRLSPV